MTDFYLTFVCYECLNYSVSDTINHLKMCITRKPVLENINVVGIKRLNNFKHFNIKDVECFNVQADLCSC